jgi:hypothetical protein
VGGYAAPYELALCSLRACLAARSAFTAFLVSPADFLLIISPEDMPMAEELALVFLSARISTLIRYFG